MQKRNFTKMLIMTKRYLSWTKLRKCRTLLTLNLRIPVIFVLQNTHNSLVLQHCACAMLEVGIQAIDGHKPFPFHCKI